MLEELSQDWGKQTLIYHRVTWIHDQAGFTETETLCMNIYFHTKVWVQYDFLMFVSDAHQGCIYLIKNIEKW